MNAAEELHLPAAKQSIRNGFEGITSDVCIPPL